MGADDNRERMKATARILKEELYPRHHPEFIAGVASAVMMLSEAFKNLDDRGWDVVSEGLADPEGADATLLRLLGTRGKMKEIEE